METKYKPVVWALPNDFDSKEMYIESLSRLDMTSSPGIPYCREATTNGAWLGWNQVEAAPAQLERLWIDVQAVLAGTFDTYYRSFIKMEPHKLAKCEQKRWRLIIASPLPVQVAWHMLFDYQNDLEIAEALFIPSQQGIKIYGGDWKRFLGVWKQSNLVSSLDKKAWDWTAPYWSIKLELEFRYRLARGRFKEHWYEIARRLYDDAFIAPKIVTTEGLVLRQLYPGIMKSGCVNTISANSHCQVILHLAVCMTLNDELHPLPACLGDDTLNAPQHVTIEHIMAYERFGIQIKTVGDLIEFMGHTFHDSGPVPTYKSKHLIRLAYQPNENLDNYLNDMLRMYAHHDEMYRFWENLAGLLGVTIHMSREATLFWYDYSV